MNYVYGKKGLIYLACIGWILKMYSIDISTIEINCCFTKLFDYIATISCFDRVFRLPQTFQTFEQNYEAFQSKSNAKETKNTTLVLRLENNMYIFQIQLELDKSIWSDG